MGGMNVRVARVAASRFTISELCESWQEALDAWLGAEGVVEARVSEHLLGTWSAAIAEKVIEQSSVDELV